MSKNICIIHYNTPILTECLVKSINKHTPDANIYIFDNSDKLPFRNSFHNVTVLDNTNGQIINFDQWLKKYPNKDKSGGKTNKWGSAKHAYSVEKCMSLLNEPFVLLDSDVLLKKDITPIFDNTVSYKGEVIYQGKSSVKRVLPFICYINTPMCFKHGVHYFDERYMHGLRVGPRGDCYDTGAALYLLAEQKKLPHKEFKYEGEDIKDISYFDNPEIPSIYHCTQSSSVDSIFKYGEDREFLSTYAYGKGVYTAYDVEDGRNQLGAYGNAMIQFKLIGGYKNFLIFPNSQKCINIAKKYYGEKYDIYHQLRTFLSHEDAQYLYSRCGTNIEAYSHFASKYHIRGSVYQWGRTVAVLPYDFTSVVPYAVSLDGGKTFKKKINQETFERFQTSVDVEYRFGHKYTRIEKAIPGPNENGEMTGYSKVKKRNGKYNIIDIQTGKEQIPDVDSCTTMNPNNGEFQVEYEGKFYNACLDGFYDSNGEGHSWDELENFEDIDINDIDFD